MALTTTITPESLAAALKRPPGPDVEQAYALAVGVLEDALAKAWRPVPVGVVDGMVLRVGRAEYEARSRSNHGGGQATQVQGETVQRPPRDPLATVSTILARYVDNMA